MNLLVYSRILSDFSMELFLVASIFSIESVQIAGMKQALQLSLIDFNHKRWSKDRNVIVGHIDQCNEHNQAAFLYWLQSLTNNSSSKA